MASSTLIVEARKRANLTQTELAERLGTHQSVVARWETGRTNPSFDTLKRAIRAAEFDLSISIEVADSHDITLIRRELNLLPWQRLSRMVEAVNAFQVMKGVADG